MNINDFIAELPGGGARSNLFRVILPFPNFAVIGGETRKLSFLAKATSIPASTVGTIEIPYQGRKIKMAGDREFSEPLSITVLNDTDFQLRNAFERWSNAINNHTNNAGISNFANYVVDGTVEQLDRANNVIKVYNFRGLWPQNVQAIELSFEDENKIEEFVVDMQFQYWTSDTTT